MSEAYDWLYQQNQFAKIALFEFQKLVLDNILRDIDKNMPKTLDDMPITRTNTLINKFTEIVVRKRNQIKTVENTLAGENRPYYNYVNDIGMSVGPTYNERESEYDLSDQLLIQTTGPNKDAIPPFNPKDLWNGRRG